MKELKVSRSTVYAWLNHILRIVYPSSELRQLAKILILKAYVCIYVYTDTHMHAYLHPWMILFIFNFSRFLCLGVLFFYSVSIFLYHPSISSWLAS